MGVIKKLNVKIKQPTTTVIPIPKMGGVLPLIPLFAGLSALGPLSGGAAGIVSAVNAAKNAKNKLEEQKHIIKLLNNFQSVKVYFYALIRKNVVYI